MEAMMVELPALTVLMTEPDPAGAGTAVEFTNFTAPALPFKLCSPGEAVRRASAAGTMAALGAALEPRTAARWKLAAAG